MKKLVLSLAFVAIGTFAMAQQAEVKKMSPKNSANHFEETLSEMTTELGLSDDQVVKLQEAQKKREAEMAAFRETRKAEAAGTGQGAAMKSMRAKRDAELQEILTPEQYQKWQKIREEKMKKKLDNLKGPKEIKQKAETQQTEAAVN